MKLLIVRHGDPDYTIDSLTEKGWKEVEFLSEKLSKLDIKDFYVSPLGRAKDTASLTLKKMNRTATECDWLREFDVLIDRPDVTDRKIILWDWLPQDWSMDERFYQYDHWFENERLQAADTKKHYDYVTGEFDKLLAEHGYVREGHYYRVEKANNDTIVFFCHFGLECVLLSHLMSVSPNGPLARSRRCAKFRNDRNNRRKTQRNRKFQNEFLRRHFPSLRKQRTACLCSEILRMLR